MANLTPILARGNGATIAYHHDPGEKSAKRPGVIFCTGFKSDMTGGKALALQDFCRARNQQFTRFDYQGHGASSGDFAAGTIGLWLGDALAVLDAVTSGPQIVVGSSMGGWIALLMARARPARVAGIVGIAPAVDFTEELIWKRLPPEPRRAIEKDGVWYRPSDYGPEPYPITRGLIEEGRNHLLLGGSIAFDGPVRILQGMLDDAVPWQHALHLAEALTTEDVVVTLIKGGGHRLSEPADLARMTAAVAAVSDAVGGA